MLLDGLCVIDLTDHRGEVGPWYLGLLGADVIKVEPPGGSTARSARPAAPDPDADTTAGSPSRQFAAYNSGKRSVVLDPASPEDRSALLDLLATADVVVDAGPPGSLEAAGVDEATLLEVNPTIVSVIVTPFGVDGPRANQPWSELTVAALGGPVSLQGVRDRAPLKVSIPQVWRHAGTEAAVATLVALRRRNRDRTAQFVDVSAQSVMTWTMLNAMEAAEVQGFDFERAGSTVQLAVEIDLRRQAKDGFTINAPIGITCGPIIGWLVEEGIAPEHWHDQDWTTYDHRVLSGETVDPTYDDLRVALDELCGRYTREELLVRGLDYGATFAPVNTIDDLLGFDHLDIRRFWASGPNGISVPGHPLVIDGNRPEVTSPAVAPQLDGSGPEIRSSLTDSAGWPAGSDARPVGRSTPPTASSSAEPGSPLPLDGVRVADFSWIGVGPITAKALADHGATVVRVENETRLDTLRAQAPFKDDEFGLNRSNFYGSFNTSKWSMTLDLTTDGGRSVGERLVAWADVIIDSFRPGTMERLGLGPQQIHATNPAAIVVTTSLLGSGGPLSPLAGYGFHAGAIGGFTELVGWPDLGPDGPWMAYTDTIGPRFLSGAILAALDRRDRTGAGCTIEGAQLEMGLQYLAPEMIDYQLGGPLVTRNGNRDPGVAPQGVYPCAGDDQWCAVSVPDDAAWGALVNLLDRPAWATDPALATIEGREAAHDEIDRQLSAWTATHEATAVERLMCAAGLPAGKVNRSSDLRDDPQYLHRRFYRHLEHAEVGTVPYAGHQYRIRGYDNGPRFAAPCLGEHTFETCTDLLGMDADALAEAAAGGAFG